MSNSNKLLEVRGIKTGDFVKTNSNNIFIFDYAFWEYSSSNGYRSPFLYYMVKELKTGKLLKFHADSMLKCSKTDSLSFPSKKAIYI